MILENYNCLEKQNKIKKLNIYEVTTSGIIFKAKIAEEIKKKLHKNESIPDK